MFGATHEDIDFFTTFRVNKRSLLGLFGEGGCTENCGPTIDERGTKGNGNRSVRKLDDTRASMSCEVAQVLVGLLLSELQICQSTAEFYLRRHSATVTLITDNAAPSKATAEHAFSGAICSGRLQADFQQANPPHMSLLMMDMANALKEHLRAKFSASP